MVLALSILFLLTAIFLVSLTVHAPKIIALLNILMGTSVWILVSRVPAVMHPASSPIRNSTSGAIKLDTLVIFLFFLAAAVLSVVLAKTFFKDSNVLRSS